MNNLTAVEFLQLEFFKYVEWACGEPKAQKYDMVKFNEALSKAKKIEEEQSKVTEDTSDGYHTFKELYDFRKAYNVALFNEWAKSENTFYDEEQRLFLPKYDVHKSWKHNDGNFCFGGGWFIVVAVLPTGQITNHYKAEDWDLFKIPENETAKYVFDGHTGADVISRLINIK